MARKRNNNLRRRNRRQNGQHVLLKQIAQNTRAEMDVDPPLTPDKIPMTLSNRKLYTFKRSWNGSAVVSSTAVTNFGALSFYLGLFDSTSEIAENYQLYRILEITVKFIPTAEVVNSGASTTNTGNIWSVIDLRNDTVPISIAELEQYKTVQVVRTGTRFTRCFTPRTLGQAFAGVTPAYYVMPANVWCSTDYNDLVYYGIKWAVGANVGLGSAWQPYTIQVDAVIQCKNTL